MGRGKMLTAREQGKIDAYLQLKLSKADIARRIRRSVHAITSYVQQGAAYGSNFKGRSRATTKYDDRRLLREASNCHKSSAKLKHDLGLAASSRTIRRRIQTCPHLERKKMLKKPPLSHHHKQDRLSFCRANMAQTWQNVWFTDEKKFNLDGPDCQKYYFHDLRKEPHVASHRQQGGGGVMVWAGFSARGKTSICFMAGKQDSKCYQKVLQEQLLPLWRSGDRLVQDNAPIHTSGASREWMKQHKIATIEWPSRSPDLNPMENIWGALTRLVYAEGRQFTKISDLRQAILEAWKAINLRTLKDHCASMSNRIFHCITAKGSFTKY